MSNGLEAHDTITKETAPLQVNGEAPSGGNATEAGEALADPGRAGASPVPVLKNDPVYQAIRDFRTVIGGSLTEFHNGDLIHDPTVVKMLLASRSPIIPVEDDHRYVICPACKHQFPILED